MFTQLFSEFLENVSGFSLLLPYPWIFKGDWL